MLSAHFEDIDVFHSNRLVCAPAMMPSSPSPCFGLKVFIIYTKM
jgi:hypothetical protein